MKIHVRCDCGKKLVAAGELAGKKTKCPACGAVIRLPLLDEASEQPASFLVTETGLNLTSDSQEGFAAPGEEMPPQFNFSALEQAAATSPECESTHGVSDSKVGQGCESSTDEDPVDLRPLWKPSRVRQVSPMRMLGSVVGRIPGFQFAMRVERGTAIRIVAGIGLVAWLMALGSQPYSVLVRIHYLGLAVFVVGVTLEIAGRVPRLKPFGTAISVFAVLGAWWLWPQFDCYDERWESGSGTTFTDSRTRSGRHYHRRLRTDTEKQRDGSYIYGERAEGPMAGDPPKPHGHWERFEFKSYSTTHMWYWYGDSITQGEWELRNK